jgi:hypothetical protein
MDFVICATSSASLKRSVSAKPPKSYTLHSFRYPGGSRIWKTRLASGFLVVQRLISQVPIYPPIFFFFVLVIAARIADAACLHTMKPNQRMKPTAPLRGNFGVFATTPSTSSRVPASLARFASSRSRTPAVLFSTMRRGLSLFR